MELDLNRYAHRLVLQNLIDNAVKFTSEGTVEVRVEPGEDEVFVHVRDTGIGMRENFLPRMYEAFVQESEGHTREFEGCGLGLTIAKRLVELMGGTIDVETERGHGSLFSVSLPVAVHLEA